MIDALNLAENLALSLRAAGEPYPPKAIGEALRVNGALTSLNLRETSIGADGAAAIAEGLKVNGALTSLDIRWNDLGAGEGLLRGAVKTKSGPFKLQVYWR